MKTISLPWFVFWICCFVVVAFIVGRHFEQTTAIKGDVGDLKQRVDQLEVRNIRHEERWGWVSRIGSRIPFVRGFFL